MCAWRPPATVVGDGTWERVGSGQDCAANDSMGYAILIGTRVPRVLLGEGIGDLPISNYLIYKPAYPRLLKYGRRAGPARSGEGVRTIQREISITADTPAYCTVQAIPREITVSIYKSIIQSVQYRWSVGCSRARTQRVPLQYL